MRMALVTRTALGLVLMLGWPLYAQATPLTWWLNGVVFNDGGTANGSFVYDADTDIYSDVSIVTTAGSAHPGTTYNHSFEGNASYIRLVPNAGLPDLTGEPLLMIFFAGMLTNAGGVVPIHAGFPSLEGSCTNFDCTSGLIYREVASGAVVPELTTAVPIDIKPGSDPNSINPFSRGVIPVAILTIEDFDALAVDEDSVLFGPAEAEKRHKRVHVEDVDGDGDLDLLLHFRTQDTGIAPGDTEACLTGQTYDGVPIMGCDSVRTVPPN